MEEEMIWFQAPTMRDLKSVEEDIVDTRECENRRHPRIHLNVPAQVRTSRGNIVKVITMDVSSEGIGFLHRGPISIDQQVEFTWASETREYRYQLNLLWTQVCKNGMWRSGGRFVRESE